MKHYLSLCLGIVTLLVCTSACANPHEEIGQLCDALSAKLIEAANLQSKPICISRLQAGSELALESGGSIRHNHKTLARKLIMATIERIGMSELSGCKELNKLHYAKVDAYQIRNEIDALP